MKNEKAQKEIEVLYEGMLDRISSRISGGLNAAKTFGSNIPKVVSGGSENISDSYNIGKFKSIVESFKTDMQKLFGAEWITKYPELAKALNRATENTVPTAAAPANPPPLPQNPPPSAPTNAPAKTPVHTTATGGKPASGPGSGLLSKKQFNTLKRRIDGESKIRRRVSVITGKPEGQLSPTAKYDYKQIMALKKLIGESVDMSFDEISHRLSENYTI